MSGPSPCPVTSDMPAYGNTYAVQSPSAPAVWQPAQRRYLDDAQSAQKRLPGSGGEERAGVKVTPGRSARSGNPR